MDQLNKNHKLVLIARNKMNITGVIDVISFDMNSVVMETTEGILHIKGNDIKVGRIELDSREVDVEGNIDSVDYTSTHNYEVKGKSVLKRMFK